VNEVPVTNPAVATTTGPDTGREPHVAEEPAAADYEVDWLAPKPEQSLWASFTQADRKVFLITFAGTVAANVATVLVVALAVIIARSSHTGWFADTGLALTFGMMCLTQRVKSWYRQEGRRITSPALITYVACFAVLLTVLLLVLVGRAAGIK